MYAIRTLYYFYYNVGFALPQRGSRDAAAANCWGGRLSEKSDEKYITESRTKAREVVCLFVCLFVVFFSFLLECTVILE